MSFLPGLKIKSRESIRLKGYDYSQKGAYFVTICTYKHKCLFGDMKNGKMGLNDAGRVVEKCWDNIPEHFPHVKLHEFIIMPNHIHGILSVGAKNFSPVRGNHPPVRGNHPPAGNERPRGTSKTIGSVVRGFKIGVTKWMRNNKIICNVWQRNYYEHVIRDENDLNRIRGYIVNNPLKWAEDKYY